MFIYFIEILLVNSIIKMYIYFNEILLVNFNVKCTFISSKYYWQILFRKMC